MRPHRADAALILDLYGVYDRPGLPILACSRRNFIPNGGALIRKAAYDAVGGYDPELKWAEDYELRLRLATFGPMIHTDELVYPYRRHGEGWTALNLDISQLVGTTGAEGLEAQPFISAQDHSFCASGCAG